MSVCNGMYIVCMLIVDEVYFKNSYQVSFCVSQRPTLVLSIVELLYYSNGIILISRQAVCGIHSGGEA